jgi:hypothetical protein
MILLLSIVDSDVLLLILIDRQALGTNGDSCEITEARLPMGILDNRTSGEEKNNIYWCKKAQNLTDSQSMMKEKL